MPFRRSLDNEWRYSLRLHTPFIVSYLRHAWQEKTAHFPTGKLSGNRISYGLRRGPLRSQSTGSTRLVES